MSFWFTVMVLTVSEVTEYAMCGRRGSTLMVCDCPMWLVSPISTGFLTSVMSMISMPPWGAPRPASSLSWQRPGASEASSSSCASLRCMFGMSVFWIVLPLGVASTSCWRPVMPSVSCGQAAEGWLPTIRGLLVGSPLSVSWTMDWPPPLAPVPRTPTEA